MKPARSILFVSYGGGHIAMVLPVMRALRAQHRDWKIELLALTTAGELARRQGVASVSYADFSHWYDARRLRDLAEPMMEATQHPLVSRRETEAYLGINFADLEDELGAQEAHARYAKMGRWSFRPLRFMKRVLAQMRPDVVVTTNSPRTEQAAIEAAKAARIPSVCMVDLLSPPGDPFLDRSIHADVLTTISELGKRNLVAGGVPAQRIQVTGSPAFDGLADPRRAQEAAADRIELAWRGKKIILWAGNLEAPLPESGPESDPAWFGQQVERILRCHVLAHADTALVVRYHPNQAQHFSAEPAQERVLWSNPLERHPHRDILLADLVVVNGSTIGLEAAIAAKSVLAMDNSPSRHVFPLSEFRIARGVPSFDALDAEVGRALRQPFLTEFAQHGTGAAERVANVVSSLAG